MGRQHPPLKVRNRHAIHPLMGKGGSHEKSTGAKRAAAKRAVRLQLAKPAADVLLLQSTVASINHY